jgi:hypothetical protein
MASGFYNVGELFHHSSPVVIFVFLLLKPKNKQKSTTRTEKNGWQERVV